jgi:predicted nucleic acid-binding protein
VILVDTSAWVEFDRATGSRVHLRLHELIESEAPVSVTEPVIMEVVSGARDDLRERDLRRLLHRFELLPFDAAVDFDGATRNYRSCRKAGLTLRSLIDCMIASVAMRYDSLVLAHDADFARMADVLALELDPASLPQSK